MLKLYKDHQFLTSVNWHRVMIEAEGVAIYCYHQYRCRYVYFSSSVYTQCALLVTRQIRHIYRAIIRDRYPLVRFEFTFRLIRYILAQESLWFIRTIQYPRELYMYIYDWLSSRFVMDQWLKDYLMARLWSFLVVS